MNLTKIRKYVIFKVNVEFSNNNQSMKKSGVSRKTCLKKVGFHKIRANRKIYLYCNKKKKNIPLTR